MRLTKHELIIVIGTLAPEGSLIYWFEKYLEPGLKKRCKKWCEDFNYANHAIEEVTKKKETFIPVQEEDMIQL